MAGTMSPCPSGGCRSAPPGRPGRSALGNDRTGRVARAGRGRVCIAEPHLPPSVCQAVLQFERGNGQAVDEQAEVEGKLGVVLAVTQLAGDAEDVCGEALGGLGVARRRGAVEEVHRGWTVFDTLAQ